MAGALWGGSAGRSVSDEADAPLAAGLVDLQLPAVEGGDHLQRLDARAMVHEHAERSVAGVGPQELLDLQRRHGAELSARVQDHLGGAHASARIARPPAVAPPSKPSANSQPES